MVLYELRINLPFQHTIKLMKEDCFMIRNITVIGAGSTGYAATAFFAAKGFQVTLCDNADFADVLEPVRRTGGILARGSAVQGFFTPAAVTADHREALEHAELIMVCVPAMRQEEVAGVIAPYLKPGQHILLSPGNLGSFGFRRVLSENGVDPEANIIAELEGNLCPCRISGKAEVTIGLPIRGKKVSALPGSRTAEFIEFAQGVLDWIPNKNVFEGALLSDNYVLHIGTTLLSAAKIEEMGESFILFQHGLSDAAIRCTEAIRQERRALVQRFGLDERDSATEFFEELRDWKNHPEYSVFRTLEGPDSLTHRYVSEDCWACGALALSCADRLGLPMPTLRAIIQLASSINGTDYAGTGRNLENLGFDAELSMEDIVRQIS